MKKNAARFVLLLVIQLTLLLCACGGNTSTKTEGSSDNKTLQGPTKEVEIGGTTYTIKEDWLVEDKGEGQAWIYCQDTVPEKIHNIIMISSYENLSEEVAASGLGTRDLIRNTILPEFKQSLRKTEMVQDDYVEEYFDLPETPVLHLKGQMNINQHDVYLFMNDYTHLVMVQYYHNADEDYSADVRTIIETLKFSYDGFLEDKTEDNTLHGPSVDGNTDKKSCDGEPYGAGSDWAKYDKNGDGCINDSEFQAGMGDAIENKVNGTSSGPSNTDRTGLCEFKENGKYVCNKKAMSGYSYCKEHWDLLYSTYNNLVGN